MKTYWEINAANGKNYYVALSPKQTVQIWEDTNHDRYSEAGTEAYFKDFLEDTFYQGLVRDNMGEAILQEVIASIQKIQNKQV